MFYIFHGKDSHAQKKQLATLLARMGDPAMLDLNTTRLEGLVPLDKLRQACGAMPFLSSVRLVIVSGLLTAKLDKDYLKVLICKNCQRQRGSFFWNRTNYPPRTPSSNWPRQIRKGMRGNSIC
jgi:hypothetical protein